MDEREELNRDDVDVCRNPGEINAEGFTVCCFIKEHKLGVALLTYTHHQLQEGHLANTGIS